MYLGVMIFSLSRNLNYTTYIWHLRREFESGIGGDIAIDMSQLFLHLTVLIRKSPGELKG